jgi:beta-mannosidase
MISQEIRDNWKFKKQGDEKWLPASVPGCVHTDLLKNELIRDPFFGINAKDLLWIEKEDWVYQCVFNISPYVLDHDQIELWFYGLDTLAEVCLNGEKILVANNMFHPWSADIKKLLHEGENTLIVKFQNVVTAGLEKLKSHGYALPAPNDQGDPKVSPFIRKAAYNFGWDWAPRLVTSGVWKPVEIIAFNKLKIRDFYILQKEFSQSYASLLCDIELEVHSAGEYIFAIYVDKDLHSTGKLRLIPGVNKFSLPFGIYYPRFWYPRGYGKPDIYKITIDIKEGDRIMDTRQTTTGLRKVELIREKSGDTEGFHFRINGIDIFSKGTNLVPPEYFLPTIRENQYKSLIDNAVAVGMNMIRVWGGGVYENDIFYNLCNQEGIMVWQDFMFACMMYPSDTEFLDSVRNEIEFNIKRLRNHPSIVLWCGNNEVLEGYHNWGWKEELAENGSKAFESYEKIFYKLIPDTLQSLDPVRPYWPSSPSSGKKGKPDLKSGDYHFWDIIKKPLPLSSYEENTGRFMSEYGFKSYPLYKTISTFTNENEPDIRSEILEFHQGWKHGAELVERHTNLLFGKPEHFEDFLYLSQLTQTFAIKTAIEAHRRAKPFCMGTLFWQLNDCWPCSSWSAIDYTGRWKALMYELRHLFTETIVSPVIKNNILQVYLISDNPKPQKVSLSLRIITFEGSEIFSKEIECKTNHQTAEIAFSVPVDKLNIANLKDKVVLITEIHQENKRTDRNLFYFVKPVDLKLQPANPQVTFSETGNKTIMFLRSDVLIKNIFIDNPDNEGFFSDNFFDLIPGETKPVIFQTESLPSGENRFVFRSLNGIPH